MGGPGLHPAVRSDAGPRAHSVARISQFLLRALLCKGLASSCRQTENKEAAHIHHVNPGAQCVLWARFARWWHCTLRALAFGLRHRVSGPPISSQSDLILDAAFALAPMMPKCRCAEKCLSKATHLYKPLLCDKGGQVSAKGCEMLRRCQGASLRQPRQGTCTSLQKAPLYERSKFEAWAFVLAPQLVRCATVQLPTCQPSSSCSFLNCHGIRQTTCHWLRMCLLDLAQPASSLLRGSQWKMHGRARFTPSCAQRCRSARPLSRQDQPVLASRIALQRSGEQLSTNGE